MNKVQSDEIDFKEIFNILWLSKLLIFLITISFAAISFFYYHASPSVYDVTISLNLGSHKQISVNCSPDNFEFYNCSYNKSDEYKSLFSSVEIKELNSELKLKLMNSTNMDLLFFPSSTSINIEITSNNEKDLNKQISILIPEIKRFITEKDDEIIDEIINTQKLYIDRLSGLSNSLKKLINESSVRTSKIIALDQTINDRKSLLSDENFLKSSVLHSKITLEKIKLKNIIFSLFLGLFISVLIVFFRVWARERVNQ